MNQHPGHKSIEFKVYPHIVHTIKSFNITMEMPGSIKMMRTKLQAIEELCEKMGGISTQNCYGFRYEMLYNPCI